MTVMEFSKKYNVPFYIAYEATFGAKCHTPDERTKNYDEADMFRNVMEILKQNRDKAAERVKRYDDIIKGVKKGVRSDRKGSE